MSEIEKEEIISREQFRILEEGLNRAFKNATGAIAKNTQYSDTDAQYTLAAAQITLALIELYKVAPPPKRSEPS